jgi:hypothetical protein
VDGGVFDNQGTAGLFEQDCQVLLVSDAAGQLFSETAAGGGHVTPLKRSFDIFQERVRQRGYEGLFKRKESGQVRGLAYCHLTQGLGQEAVDWEDCEDPFDPNNQLAKPVGKLAGTGYGVHKDVQRGLARMRTDLDVFSEVECAALMASGYRSMDAQLLELFEQVPALKVERRVATDWFFSPVLEVMSGPEHDPRAYRRLKENIEAGAHAIGRSARLSKPIAMVSAALGMAGLIVGGVLAWQHRDVQLLTVGSLAVLMLPFLVPVVLPSVRSSWVSFVLDPRRVYSVPKRNLLLAIPLVLFACVVTLLDIWYIERGRLQKLFGET